MLDSEEGTSFGRVYIFFRRNDTRRYLLDTYIF